MNVDCVNQNEIRQGLYGLDCPLEVCLDCHISLFPLKLHAVKHNVFIIIKLDKCQVVLGLCISTYSEHLVTHYDTFIKYCTYP